MAIASKRNKAIREQIEPGKVYGVDEALELLKKFSNLKFKESVDVAIRLGIDPRKSDQNVRGATVLPNGTGKTVRVAVFTQGDNVQKALVFAERFHHLRVGHRLLIKVEKHTQ